MPVSLATMQAMLAQHSDRQLVECLTISTEDATLRVLNDSEELERDAGTFSPFPFELMLHSDEDDKLPQAEIRIDVVDQTIIQALREPGSPPQVIAEVVTREDPNVVDAGPFRFDMTGAQSDGVSSVRMALGFNTTRLSAAFPAGTFSRSNAGA